MHERFRERALVAGGAGFIGSHLCDRLLADGWQVYCVDDLSSGRMQNIDHLLGDVHFRFIRHDVIEPMTGLAPCRWVFNLASPASPPGYKRRPVQTLRVNSEGTRHLLDLASAWGSQFLYASTSEAYGDPLEHPQTESYRGNVSSTGPRSMYDEAKRFGEAMTMAYHRTEAVDARIVRIFNTYGPRSDPADGRIVPNFVSQALRGEPMTVYGDGTQTRSLCFVSDLVEGLLAAMRSSSAAGQVINLGNPEEHSVLEFAEIVKSLCVSDSPIVFREPAVGDDPQRRRPDISRARDLLGWEPAVGLMAGLFATIGYFREELAKDPVPAGMVPATTSARAGPGLPREGMLPRAKA